MDVTDDSKDLSIFLGLLYDGWEYVWQPHSVTNDINARFQVPPKTTARQVGDHKGNDRVGRQVRRHGIS